MTTAASLWVSIGCREDDFVRGMSRAEKSAQRGFQNISDAAKQMTEYITAPVALAGLAVAKLAADAQEAGARVDRVFGSMSDSVKQQLEAMTAVIPETTASMEALAVKSDNMLQGLGYGAEKAAGLSVSMVKLAGDMAAFAHVPVADALEALDRGLAGKTRGLIQFGIVVSAQQIHLEALRRGLLDNHQTLTQLGTAEIAESLIRQASTRITGEAARTAGEASKSFAFLKRDIEEMGVSLGTITLPPVIALAQRLRDIVDAVTKADQGVKTIAVWGVGISAALIPAILVLTRIAKEVVVLGRLAAVLAAGEGIGAFIGAIAAAPVATAVAAIVAITAAAEGLYWVWQKFQNQGAGRAFTPVWTFTPLAPRPTPPAAKLAVDSRTDLEKFRSDAALIQDQYKNAVDMGQSLIGPLQQINALHSKAVGLLAQQNGQWTEMAQAAAAVAKATRDINSLNAVAFGGASAAAASQTMTSDDQIKLNDAKSRIDYQTGLRQRTQEFQLKDEFNVAAEALIAWNTAMTASIRDLGVRNALLAKRDPYDAVGEAVTGMGEQIRRAKNDLDFRAVSLQLKDGFDAAKTAAVELGEEQRRAANDVALSAAKIGAGLDVLFGSGKAMRDAMAVASTPKQLEAAAALGNFRDKLANLSEGMQTVVVAMFDAVTNFAQGLAQKLAGSGKGAGVGGMIGSLFGSALTTGVGALVTGAFAPLVAAAAGIGGALIGSLFDHPTKAADTAAQSLNTMAAAAQQVSTALYNIPNGFKVALAQYRGQAPLANGSAWYPSAGATGGGGNTYVVNVNGSTDPKQTAREVLKAFRSAAQNTYADSTRWASLMAI